MVCNKPVCFIYIQVSKDEKNILKDVEKTEVSSPTLSLFLFCILDLCNRLKGYLFEVQTTPY
jgi:hypothetical protein